jgi:hypothetical protein
MSATTGATTKELMARLGHSSPRAAMIYQHATRDRDKLIVQGLGKLLEAARTAPAEESGPSMAQRGSSTAARSSKSDPEQ